MRKTVCILCALLFMGTMMSYAQQDTIKPEGYKFTDVKRLPATSVKDQYRAGTCWSWATTSFLESEMMRMGKDSVNLSAMYFVKHAYSDKAEKYVKVIFCENNKQEIFIRPTCFIQEKLILLKYKL